jgi:hypothetical protein
LGCHTTNKKLGCHKKTLKKTGVPSKKKGGGEDNLTRNKPTINKKLPEGFLLAENQSTKINLIGCDTI